MAIVDGGLHGKPRNSVGDITYFEWKGRTVARLRVTPTNPKTPAQTENRTVFGTVPQAGSLVLTSIVHPYWNPFGGNIGGWATFIKVNRLAQGTNFDPNLLIMAKGSLESANISQAINDAGSLSIDWNTATIGNGEATDEAVGVVYDVLNGVAFVSDTGTPRSDGSLTIEVGAGRVSAQLKAYIFFNRGAGSSLIVSNSTFFQVVDA